MKQIGKKKSFINLLLRIHGELVLARCENILNIIDVFANGENLVKP